MTVTTRNASAEPLSPAPSHQRAGGVRQASRAGYAVAAKPAPVCNRPDKSTAPAGDAAATIAALVKHNASPPSFASTQRPPAGLTRATRASAPPAVSLCP